MWNPDEITPIGKTYGEIDRDRQRYVEEANATLRSMSSAGTRWWLYTVSLCTFEIVVGNPLGQGNIVLCLNACERIEGPVSWQDQRLKVIWKNVPTSENRHWEFEVIDEGAGFRAKAGTFGWQRDYDIVAKGSLCMPRGDD